MTFGVVLTTLRMHRMQIVVTAVSLLALVVVAALHGSATAAFIAEQRAGDCAAHGCLDLPQRVADRYRLLGEALPYLGLVPVAIGVFWGAPLLGREFEAGTSRLAWTQSVSRRRWILTRLIVLGGLVAVGGVVMGVVVAQWLSVFEGFELTGVTDASFIILRGVEPVGWWLFGFLVGVAAGALLRRTVRAMAVTAGVGVGAIIARNLLLVAQESATPSTGWYQDHLLAIVVLGAAVVVLSVLTTRVVERARP